MNLLRLDKDGNNLGHAKEEDLLNHFLQTPRPIPIVGKAGVGKSHIIRWLDAKLRLRKEYKDKKWHIVRIPKSASLREFSPLCWRAWRARSLTKRGKTSIRCRKNVRLARSLNGC